MIRLYIPFIGPIISKISVLCLRNSHAKLLNLVKTRLGKKERRRMNADTTIYFRLYILEKKIKD